MDRLLRLKAFIPVVLVGATLLAGTGDAVAADKRVRPTYGRTHDRDRAAPVTIDGWRIHGDDVRRSGGRLRLRHVYATRGVDGQSNTSSSSWSLVADRLDVGVDPAAAGTARWMWARGHVRVAGPDGVYVIAGQAASVMPARRWRVWSPRSDCTLAKHGWRLTARTMTVEVDANEVQLHGVGRVALVAVGRRARGESIRFVQRTTA